ncbi:hypothetical protein APHAL10511_008461 [Amanita phalloides]|nr:hypothetical protein APHAL10511_008461 [Amanita phalloides]
MKSSVMLPVWFITLWMNLLFVDCGWAVPIIGGLLTSEQTPDAPAHPASLSAPHFVLYSDWGLPHPTSINGFNTLYVSPPPSFAA